MKIGTALKHLIKAKGTNYTKLAEKMGYSSNSSIRNMVATDMRISNIVKTLDVLEYEVVIQPKSTRGKRPRGAYVISLEDDVGTD